MTERIRRDAVSGPRRSGYQASPGAGNGRPPLVEIQAIIILAYCLFCVCCSVTAYVWGSASPRLADIAPFNAPSPTRTATRVPTTVAISTQTLHPTTTLTETSASTDKPLPTEPPPISTPASQSPLATPTSAPTSPPTPTRELPPPSPPEHESPSLPTSTPTEPPTPTGTPSTTPVPTNTSSPTPTGSPTPTPTPIPSDLHVDHVEWNPQGEDLDGEYVLIKNYGTGSQNMTSWTLSDDSYHIYDFPSGFILPGGSIVRVWTKSGTDSGTDLYWGRSSAVWGNQGDTAFLRDRVGTLIDSVSWAPEG
jgi:hypothetical protein